MKIAYFVTPHIGGTYSVFKALRSGLAPFGTDLQWLGLARGAEDLSPAFERERAFGTLVRLPSGLDGSGIACRLESAVVDGGFDGVIVNVLADQAQMNIVRYLAPGILRLMIVHNMTPGTYAAARALRPHVHATVCVSVRCRDDLLAQHGFSPSRTFVVANAVGQGAIAPGDRPLRPAGEGLRLLFLGRIEDASKGVLWLPRLAAGLPRSARLTVAGEGPDLPRLKKALPQEAGRVVYSGAVRPEAVPALLGAHDVFVMPSRYEGLPMALLEAMAAGCVPVASRLRGVTDTIVEHGQNGLLFPVGDAQGAASHIRRLDEDRDKLRAMAAAARQTVAQEFTAERMAAAYAAILRDIEARPGLLAEPLDLARWSLPPGLRAGMRTFVPRPLKNWLRAVRERL